MEIERCRRCVMDDSSDATIRFDENGYCNYCTTALQQIGITYMPNKQGEAKLNELLDKVKKNGRDKPYDCIMGLSGGLDSSYLAYLGYKWGLRVLAVHIDDGYDTEISKRNIERLVSATGFDYEVIKPDAKQYNALTLAYMKAGVPNLAVPQDNILSAFLQDCMKKHKIKYFFSGDNFALESILQKGNTCRNTDVVNIKDINKRFGTLPIDELKFRSTVRAIIDKKLFGIQTICALNYVDYNRDRAFSELGDFCGFTYYGGKHLENILTAFIQLYWFPKKFNVDKRTSHLYSMIVSGQMTREQALLELEKPLYDEEMMEQYITIVKTNLEISDEEFDRIMATPTHQHNEYAVEDQKLYYRIFRFIYHAFGIQA